VSGSRKRREAFYPRRATRSDVPTDPTIPVADGSLRFPGADDVLAVDPSAALVADLIDAWTAAAPAAAAPDADALADGRAPPSNPPVAALRLLAREPVLEEVLGEFHAASRAAGLRAADRLSVRVLAEPATNSLLVGGGCAAVVVGDGDRRLAVAETGPGTVATVRDGYREAWEGAEPYALRTPDRARVWDAFADRFDEGFARDLHALLDAGGEVRRGDPCDHFVRPYLIGARREAHHYDLRRAGEEAGLASQATFSRIKAALVEDGIVETTQVRRRVGRPRQRVAFADERFQGAPLSEYPELVAELR